MDQLATMLADAESVQEATATAAKREVFIEISVGVMKEGLETGNLEPNDPDWTPDEMKGRREVGLPLCETEKVLQVSRIQAASEPVLAEFTGP